MARFILDVANLGFENRIEEFIKELFDQDVILAEIAEIVIIDDSDDNQFHEDVSKNILNKKQIDRFNNYRLGEYK